MVRMDRHQEVLVQPLVTVHCAVAILPIGMEPIVELALQLWHLAVHLGRVIGEKVPVEVETVHHALEFLQLDPLVPTGIVAFDHRLKLTRETWATDLLELFLVASEEVDDLVGV